MQKSVEETKEKMAEDVDKMNRRNNVIIYNVPESKAALFHERMMEDKKYCLDLMKEVLHTGHEEGDIKKLVRLGKQAESGKPRPLLVEFCDGRVKNLVMENVTRLAHATGVFKGVVIAHDMTKKEREQCKILVEEAKKKQLDDESGEWVYKVRGSPGQMKIEKFKRMG